MGKHTPGLCGCRVQAVRWSPSRTEAAFEVVYCPTHQAAPDLLDAAKMLLSALAWEERRSGTTYNGTDSLRAAIVKAEG